jgi:hypothetical protein
MTQQQQQQQHQKASKRHSCEVIEINKKKIGFK